MSNECTERMSHNVNFFQFKFFDKGCYIACKFSDRIRRFINRFVRFSVAAVFGHINAIAFFGKRRRHLRPRNSAIGESVNQHDRSSLFITCHRIGQMDSRFKVNRFFFPINLLEFGKALCREGIVLAHKMMPVHLSFIFKGIDIRIAAPHMNNIGTSRKIDTARTLDEQISGHLDIL